MPRTRDVRGVPPLVMQPVSNSQVMTQTATHAQTRARARWDKALTILFFLVPPLLLYVYLVIFPVVQAVYYSFWKWNGLGPLTNFIGFDNYVNLFHDGVFLRAFSHNWLIAFLSVVLQLPFALGMALILGRKLVGRGFFRVILFLPYVLSEVVTGVIWTFIYRVDGGLLNTTLQAILPFFKPLSWLGDPGVVMFAVFLALTWKYFGIYLILYIAGLQNIPSELEDAARIDGASGWQVTRYIVLPLLGSTTRLTIYLAIVGSLQVFDLVWIMTTGGPVNASDTMATYLYKFGFQRFALGYGSTVAVIIFLVAFSFSLLYQHFVLQRDLN